MLRIGKITGNKIITQGTGMGTKSPSWRDGDRGPNPHCGVGNGDGNGKQDYHTRNGNGGLNSHSGAGDTWIKSLLK